MLSKTKYAALCVLGTEIFYVLCVGYGLLLSGTAMEPHNGLLGLIPVFAWGNPVSIALGAVYLGSVAWFAGWYIAWMHNTTLVTRKK